MKGGKAWTKQRGVRDDDEQSMRGEIARFPPLVKMFNVKGDEVSSAPRLSRKHDDLCV